MEKEQAYKKIDGEINLVSDLMRYAFTLFLATSVGSTTLLVRKDFQNYLVFISLGYILSLLLGIVFFALVRNRQKVLKKY